jgi:hypothetical protein
MNKDDSSRVDLLNAFHLAESLVLVDWTLTLSIFT